MSKVKVSDINPEAATTGQVPIADGSGGIAWGDQSGGGGGGGGGVTLTRLSASDYLPRVASNIASGYYVTAAILVPFNCTINSIIVPIFTTNAAANITPVIYAAPAIGSTSSALLASGPEVAGVTQGEMVLPLTTPLEVTTDQIIYIGFLLRSSSIQVCATRENNVSGPILSTADTTPGNPITLGGDNPDRFYSMAASITMTGGISTVSKPAIRGSNITSSSASSYNVSFPAGSVAGDIAIVMVGHGYSLNAPVGWIEINNLAGANFNGAVFAKRLTSGDITTGYVTVTATGTYNGVISCVTLVGTAGISISEIGWYLRSSSGSSTQNLPVLSTGAADLTLAFAFNRGTSDNTLASGTLLQSINASNASGAVYSIDPYSEGFDDLASFSVAGSGYYVGVLCISSGQSGGGGGNWWNGIAVPTAASLTALSSDATLATLSDDADVGLVVDPGTLSGAVARCAYLPLTGGGSNWTATMHFSGIESYRYDLRVGMIARESSTGKTAALGYECNNHQYTAQYGSNHSVTWTSTVGTWSLPYRVSAAWFRMQNDAGTLRYFWSDDGKNWKEVGSGVALTTAFTTAPDQIGIWMRSGASTSYPSTAAIDYFEVI